MATQKKLKPNKSVIVKISPDLFRRFRSKLAHSEHTAQFVLMTAIVRYVEGK